MHLRMRQGMDIDIAHTALAMASLEFIKYSPVREKITGGTILWVPDPLGRPIEGLPQIFWEDGTPWHEANHFALEKIMRTEGGHIKTVTSVMKHLHAFATWLEFTGSDWRHFPNRKDERTIFRYRGALIDQRDKTKSIAPSTTRGRMAGVIQFYRHCQAYRLLSRDCQLRQDHQVVVRFFDNVGFERTMYHVVSELSIPNRARHGATLEAGLTPLRIEDAKRLLEFTKEQGLQELNLMVSLGTLTGARIDTIVSLGVKDIEAAYPDPKTPNTYLLRAGPGTDVRTKFDAQGNLLVPIDLINELKAYVYSIGRLKRQDLASKENRGLLFLTSRGNPYVPSTFNRLMTDLRRSALFNGLRFMEKFKFHQTRATFGTWAMGVALANTDAATAVAFVRDAMFHKNESTTLRYVKFIENNKAMIAVANSFAESFSGIVKRDWNKYHA